MACAQAKVGLGINLDNNPIILLLVSVTTAKSVHTFATLEESR